MRFILRFQTAFARREGGARFGTARKKVSNTTTDFQFITSWLKKTSAAAAAKKIARVDGPP